LSLDDDNAQWQDTMTMTCNNARWSATSTYIVQRWYTTMMRDNDGWQQEVTIVKPDLPTFFFCQLTILNWNDMQSTVISITC